MLKGKTRIELRDVHTGKVDVVEEGNMVTNALQYIFNPMGYIKGADPMVTTEYVNYYMTLTGGLLLLDKALEEGAENMSLPGSVGQTGCAVYGQQNTSGQTLRGNFNATETEVDIEERRIKYVYDFDTAEGNGTIACVALTHALGGYGNRGLPAETAPARGLYPFYKSIGSGYLRLTGSDSAIGAYDRTIAYSTYGTGYKWIIKIDAATDTVYYFTVMSTTSVRIWKYRANISTISLFDRPGAERTLQDYEDVTLTQAAHAQYFSYNYDEETDKLYIVSASSYYVANNAAFLVTEIDMAEGHAVRQYPMQNKSGANMRICNERCDIYCYRGYLYFMNYGYSVSYYIYRQEIGNPANIQKIDAAVRSSFPMMARDGLVYYEYATNYSGSYCVYVVDTDTFTMKIPETYNLYDSNRRQYVPVYGFPLTYYLSNGSTAGTFAVRTDYLATINNLPNPVVKTADKTMKVTYILQES